MTRSQTDDPPKKRNNSVVYTLNWLRETLCAEKTQLMTVPPPETARNGKWCLMKEDSDVGITCWFCGRKNLLGTIFCQCADRQKRLSEQQEVKAEEAVQAGRERIDQFRQVQLAPRRLRGFKHGIAAPEKSTSAELSKKESKTSTQDGDTSTYPS